MSFLPGFLKNKKKLEPVVTKVSEVVSLEALKELIPIRNFDAETIEAFATNLKPEIYSKDAILFKIGEPVDAALYLLEGSVTIFKPDNSSYIVKNGTAKARFPLSTGVIHDSTAIAETEVGLLRVSPKIMSNRDASKDKLSQLTIPDSLVNNRLMQAFIEYYSHEKQELLCLPTIAVKLRHAMQQDLGISEIAKIIQLDPVISAKLIQMANSPLYVCNIPANSCLEAINRIGLDVTRNLVTSLALRHVFKSHSSTMKDALERIWRHSIYISALCFMIAKLSNRLLPEEALLAGLICDIGVIPFLNFADNLPKDFYNEQDLKHVMACVKGPIGYKILFEWGFSDEMLKVPVSSTNWQYNASPHLDLTDVVILARLHAEMGRTEQNQLPVITSIPAASKLLDGGLSPTMSLNLLNEAKLLINNTLKILST